MPLKYVLDVDTCLAFLAGHPNVVARVLPLTDSELAATFITMAELYFSAYSSSRMNDNLKKVADFASNITVLSGDKHTSELAGRIKADLRRTSQPIDDASLYVACITLRHNLTLVTNTPRRFISVRGLQLENWII